MSTTATAHGGRPLDVDLSDTILDAALRVLAREGYGGFSIAAVAHEAGTHRPAIYRRWPNRTDLAVAAIQHLRPTPVDPESDDVRDDLVAFLVAVCCSSDEVQALALRLHHDVVVHDDLADAVQQQIALPRRRTLAGILQRGVRSGQLRADLDVEAATDLLLGTLTAAKTRRPALKPADVTRYVDLAVRGLGATS